MAKKPNGESQGQASQTNAQGQTVTKVVPLVVVNGVVIPDPSSFRLGVNQ